MELDAIRQKYEAWREEADRLAPFQQEAESLRVQVKDLERRVEALLEENASVSRQLQSAQQEREAERRGGDGGRRGSDYDTLRDRLTELLGVRANLEKELAPLRAERASTLQELGKLREMVKEPEKYAKLEEEVGNLRMQNGHLQEALRNERNSVQRQQEANLQLKQKLQETSNPTQLQTVRERIERYKQERDSYRRKFEELKGQVQLLEEELQKSRMNDDFREELQSRCEDLEKRMYRYREERNQYRIEMHQMRAAHSGSVYSGSVSLPVEQNPTEAATAPSSLADAETLQMTARDEITASRKRQLDKTSSSKTLPGEGGKSTPRGPGAGGALGGRESYDTGSIAQESGTDFLVEVNSSSGVHNLTGLRQASQGLLNARSKPTRVVVKRQGGEFEMGTLHYVGKMPEKNEVMAGVELDLQS